MSSFESEKSNSDKKNDNFTIVEASLEDELVKS